MPRDDLLVCPECAAVLHLDENRLLLADAPPRRSRSPQSAGPKTSTTIYLEAEQLERLRALSAREGVPVAEFVREAADAVLLQHGAHPRQAELAPMTGARPEPADAVAGGVDPPA